LRSHAIEIPSPESALRFPNESRFTGITCVEGDREPLRQKPSRERSAFQVWCVHGDEDPSRLELQLSHSRHRRASVRLLSASETPFDASCLPGLVQFITLSFDVRRIESYAAVPSDESRWLSMAGFELEALFEEALFSVGRRTDLGVYAMLVE